MKRRSIKRKKDTGGAPKWMTTYSDMITLILVFFILLFSMSQIDLEKFEAISESFRDRMIFDFQPTSIDMENSSSHSNVEEMGKHFHELKTSEALNDEDDEDEKDDKKDRDGDELDKLMEEIEAYLDENDLNDVISASRTERGVVLVLEESLLFDTAEADILEDGKPFLNKIGELLSEIPNQVEVEGHTDDRSIDTSRYPSNWELSGARASGVIRFLLDKNDFDDARFTATGYGDTRPTVDNDSPENWRKNRRVEIVIQDE